MGTVDWLPERCPVCDGSLRAASLADAQTRGVLCLSCSHRVQPTSPGGTLSWRDGTPAAPGQSSAGSRWSELDRALVRLQFVREVCPSGGRLLDLAPSPGAFARVAEAGPFLVRSAPLLEIAADSAAFDVVTLWQGLESSSTPVTDLGLVRPLLCIGGILFVDVAVLPEQAIDTGGDRAGAPELPSFSRRSIRLALARAGFDIVEARAVEASGEKPAASHVRAVSRLRSAASRLAPLRGVLARFASRHAPSSSFLAVAARRSGA